MTVTAPVAQLLHDWSHNYTQANNAQHIATVWPSLYALVTAYCYRLAVAVRFSHIANAENGGPRAMDPQLEHHLVRPA